MKETSILPSLLTLSHPCWAKRGLSSFSLSSRGGKAKPQCGPAHYLSRRPYWISGGSLATAEHLHGQSFSPVHQGHVWEWQRSGWSPLTFSFHSLYTHEQKNVYISKMKCTGSLEGQDLILLLLFILVVLSTFAFMEQKFFLEILACSIRPSTDALICFLIACLRMTHFIKYF